MKTIVAQRKSFNPWKVARLTAIAIPIAAVLYFFGWSWYAIFTYPLASSQTEAAILGLTLQGVLAVIGIAFIFIERHADRFAKWWRDNERNYGKIED